MYQDFAEIYDELMNDVDYESWAEHYTRFTGSAAARSANAPAGPAD